MVRTRAFDPTSALQAAVDVFSAKGYSDTSMDDLVKATGVSRYGLYGTFGNKRELFEQALDRYSENMGRREFMHLKDPDASLEDIRAIFENRAKQMSREGGSRGCMICHTALQIAPHDEEIQDVIQKLLDQMSRAFAKGLATAKTKGEVRKDLDVDAAGEYLTGALFGLSVLSRSGSGQDKLKTFVDNTLRSLTN